MTVMVIFKETNMNNFKIHMHVLNLRTGWYGESSSNLFFVNLLIRAVLPTQYFPTTMTFFSAFDPILKQCFRQIRLGC